MSVGHIHLHYCSQSSANYVPGNNVDKPCSLSGNTELILPSEKLRNVKVDYKHSLLHPSNEHIDLEGYTTLTYNDDKSIKIEGALRDTGLQDWDSVHEGDMKVTLSVLKLPPISYEDSYKYEPGEKLVKIIRSTTVKYDQKELTLSINPLTFDPEFSNVELKAKATTPWTAGPIDVDLKHKVSFLRC